MERLVDSKHPDSGHSELTWMRNTCLFSVKNIFLFILIPLCALEKNQIIVMKKNFRINVGLLY